MTLVDLDAALAARRHATIRRCRPSPAPSSAASSPTNAAGAATFKYGTTRDWVQGADGRARQRRRPRRRARRRRAPTPTGSSRSSLSDRRRARSGAALPDARRAEAVGRLLRRAGHGSRSICSSDRKARSASSPRSRCACCRRGRRCAWRSCRSTIARAALAFVDAAARRGARDVAHARSARHRRRRRSSTWTRAASRCCARTAPTARTASRFPTGTAIALLVTLELPRRHDRGRGVRRDRPRARPGRAGHAAGPLLPRARRRRRARRGRDRGARRRARASSSCSRCARRCRPASTRASAAPSSDRSANREDGGRHDRAVRAPRRAARRSTTRSSAPRGLDAAVWGHISDGNLHPNVIPRSIDGRRVGQGGDSRVRPRGDPARRLAARRARRRPESGQAAAAGRALRRARASTRCARSNEPWTRTSSSLRVYSSERDEAGCCCGLVALVIAAAPAVADVCRLDCARPRSAGVSAASDRRRARARTITRIARRGPDRASASIGRGRSPPPSSSLRGVRRAHSTVACASVERCPTHLPAIARTRRSADLIRAAGRPDVLHCSLSSGTRSRSTFEVCLRSAGLQVCTEIRCASRVVVCVFDVRRARRRASSARAGRSVAVDADVRRRAVRDRQPSGRAARRQRVRSRPTGGWGWPAASRARAS